jgi:hypothetical protein
VATVPRSPQEHRATHGLCTTASVEAQSSEDARGLGGGRWPRAVAQGLAKDRTWTRRAGRGQGRVPRARKGGPVVQDGIQRRPRPDTDAMETVTRVNPEGSLEACTSRGVPWR